MKTIYDINKVDDTLVFKVSSDIAIINSNDLVIYLDECTNIKNAFCDDLEVHDYVFNYSNSTITLRAIVLEGDEEQTTVTYQYEITVKSDIIKELDGNMKYIKVYVTSTEAANDYVDGIYYDPEVLYNAEIGMLRNYCSTCLDNLQMQRIMLIVHNRQLMEQAISIAQNKDVMEHYLSLCRLLDVNIKNNKKDNECKQCTNGMCSL